MMNLIAWPPHMPSILRIMTAPLFGVRRRTAPMGAALVILFMLAAPVPHASAAAEDANAFVASLGMQAGAMFQPGIQPAQRLARLRTLFRDDFDVRGIGTFALGRYRGMATPGERHEYFQLYSEFAVRAVSNRLNALGGATLRITSVQPMDGEIVVSSEVIGTNGNPLHVDWYLVHKHGRDMVTDLSVNGASMKLTLRNQFATWIETNGGRFDALLAVLRQEIPQLQ
jgi:phospholipid transport system substrate-binding protein